MPELVLIVVHALAGLVALVAAVVALERPPRALGLVVPALAVMLGALVAVITVQWAGLDTPTRAVFVALGLLGALVVARGAEAARRSTGSARRRPALAFVVIALTDAFLVVLVLDLGAPTWAVVATGLVVAAIGHVLVGARLRRLEEWEVRAREVSPG